MLMRLPLLDPDKETLAPVGAAQFRSGGRRRDEEEERELTSPAKSVLSAPVTRGTTDAGGHERLISQMTGSEDVKGLLVSLGEVHVEASPSSPSRDEEIGWHWHAAADSGIWDDASDSEGDRELAHWQNQFLKMGYRDGITEGQKDAAQEGFNVGFRQSVHVGYKWGLVRGITSALDSLPNSLKEKMLLDEQRRGKLKDLHSSVQEISAEGALQLFHESILQDNRPPEESWPQTIRNDLLLLLHECPDIQVRKELPQVP